MAARLSRPRLLNQFVGAAAPQQINASGVGVANTAYVARFQVNRPVVVSTVRFAVFAQSGNLDFALLDDSGTRLASTGSIACPGGGAHTRSLTASVQLVPGRFYWQVVAADNEVAQIGYVSNPSNGAMAGAAESVASSFPIPASLSIPTSGTARVHWLHFS